MTGLQLTPEEYVTEIIMSKDLFLLVEGSDDEVFFTVIYNHLKDMYLDTSSTKLNKLKKLRIETAEQIKGALGNRDKVETVCNLIAQESENIQERILGFVDREFREFEYSNHLKDKLNNHKINDRLIWSRGHSIENYIFEISTLRETFNGYVISSFYQEAFEIFESKFTDILRISCALSLAAKSQDLLSVIDKSLDWQCIDITSQSISINIEKWKNILKKRMKLDQLRIDNIQNDFQQYLTLMNTNTSEILRWLSHGHIGFSLMFTIYGKCLYIIALDDGKKNADKEAEKINKNKDMRFFISSKAWIKCNYNNNFDFPIKCFEILIN